uniref:fibronectin type III domain-containing protein n=1 Tax=Maribacter antarcticus TaxID=505250 RepID=UPI000478F961
MRKLLHFLSVFLFLFSCKADQDLFDLTPTLPTNLVVLDYDTDTIILQWDSSFDDKGEVFYNLYSNGDKLIEKIKDTIEEIVGLTPNTEYIFAVSSIDEAENESSQSSAVSVTTLSPADTEAPSAPLGLSSSNVTVTGVELNWSASTDNVGVTGYKVYQDGSEITQVTGTVYSVTGLGGSTTYSFTVLAIDEAENESSQSSA